MADYLPVPIKEIRDFTLRMQYKLDKNQHKECSEMNPDGKGRGWKHCSPAWLIMRLREETDELATALKEGNWENMLDECADVANFVMMVHDVTEKRLARHDAAVESIGLEHTLTRPRKEPQNEA